MKNYQFQPSTMEDDTIKKLTESREQILEILQQKDFKNMEKDFKNSVESLFVCLPNTNLPGHMYAINFMVKFRKDLSSDINQNNITFYLGQKLEKLFDSTKVNVYSEEEIKESLESELITESDKHHLKAMLSAGIPISEFSSQTNQELNDIFHLNFTKLQVEEESSHRSPSPSTRTRGNAQDLQLQEKLGLNDEQYLEFCHVNSPEIIATIKQKLVPESKYVGLPRRGAVK
jgi:hypothetical protein